MTFPEFADGARGRNRLSKNPEVSPARLRRTNGTGTGLGSQVRDDDTVAKEYSPPTPAMFPETSVLHESDPPSGQDGF